MVEWKIIERDVVIQPRATERIVKYVAGLEAVLSGGVAVPRESYWLWTVSRSGRSERGQQQQQARLHLYRCLYIIVHRPN